MRKITLLMFIVVGLASFSYGQKTITGTVKDATGEALIGATVIEQGTTNGTTSDIDGNFKLIVKENAVLVFSYLSFLNKEVSIENQTNFDITLESDALGLDEVVVIGYVPQRRKDLTGSVSSLNTQDIEDIQLPSIETALQGRTAGVQVIKNSGKPGGGIDVNIRGRTSITASNQPLYVVDGVPIISGDNFDFSQEGIGGSNVSVLSDINQDDIESMEVLKDAATAAIYGSRAANGVVLITTKKGRANKTTVSLSSSYGGQWAPKRIEIIDGPTYLDYVTQQYGENIVGTEANTNWQDEIFQTGIMQKYNLSLSGGDAKTQFFASGGFNDEQGIMKNSSFGRYSGRLNLNHLPFDRVRLEMNIGYTSTNTKQIQNDNNIYGALGAAILVPPIVPIYNEDGTYGGAFGIENAVAAVTDYDNNITRGRLISNVAANYNILDNLSFRASLGLDIINQNEKVYEPRVLQSSANGRAVVATVADNRIIHDYVLKFADQFGQSNIVVFGGTSFQEDKINQTYTEATNFPTDAFIGLNSGAESVTTSGSFTGDNLRSFFGGLNYKFGDRYYLTASFRADGSSRFTNNQWGYFPGVSLGWNISNESFLKDGPFDLLKIRLGWGQTGNNNIGNFAALQLYGGGFNYRDMPGIAPSQIGNPELKWETTTQSNIGIDFGILKNRLTASLDFYIKNTQDLLLDRPIPTTSGFTSVLENVGEVENRGIDLTINTLNIDRKNIKWETTFIGSYLKNEVVKLVDGVPFDAGFANRIAEGQPIGVFFGHQTDGIFQNQAEIEGSPTQATAEPGDIRFADLSGGAGEDGILGTTDDLAPDGNINDDDRTYIGKALPDFTGGITNTLNIYGIELSGFFQFATGHQIYNNNRAFAEGLNGVFAPTQNAWDNRWKEEGDQTSIPRMVLNDPNNNRRESDRYVEDADYVRLKTLTLGYQLPSKLLSKINVKNLKFFVSGFNLWTATSYSWFDPEVNGFDGSNIALGTDFLTYPQPRSVVGGLKFEF